MMLVIYVFFSYFVITTKCTDSWKEPYSHSISGTSSNGDLSHQAYLISVKTKRTCCGTIVTPRWIMTSGSCIHGENNCNFNVTVGTNTLNDQDAKYYHSEYINCHEMYMAAKGVNSIGMVRLTTDIIFTASCKPVTLPRKDMAKIKTSAMSAFWDNSTSNSASLQTSNINIVDNKMCKSEYPAYEMSKLNICTESKSGSCNDNDGSPLIIDGTIVGVLHHEEKCRDGSPAVYTNVYRYLSWVREQVSKFEVYQ